MSAFDPLRTLEARLLSMNDIGQGDHVREAGSIRFDDNSAIGVTGSGDTGEN